MLQFLGERDRFIFMLTMTFQTEMVLGTSFASGHQKLFGLLHCWDFFRLFRPGGKQTSVVY